MAATKYIVPLIAIVFAFVYADEQYITIYDQKGSAGVSVNIQEKLNNFNPELKEFLKNASSYCAVGWWVGYTNPEFNIDGGVGILLDKADGTPRCNDRVFLNFNSLRYLGNKNSNTSSIAFYSKSSYHGLEQLVDEQEGVATNVTFPPLSFVTTGYSNWTFYEGPALTGNSWCVESITKVTLVADIDSTWPKIQSFTGGCK